MSKTLYFNEGKDFKKLLKEYYIHPGDYQVGSGYSEDWLYGYVACLYASMIINDKKRHELNCFIKEMGKKGGEKDENIRTRKKSERN